MIENTKLDEFARHNPLKPQVFVRCKYHAMLEVFCGDITHKDHPEDVYDATAAVFDYLQDLDLNDYACSSDILETVYQYTGADLTIWEQFEDNSMAWAIKHVRELYDCAINLVNDSLAIQELT